MVHAVRVIVMLISCCLLVWAEAAPTTEAPPGGVVDKFRSAPNTSDTVDSCRVLGGEYRNGQQVPRADPCELCVCLEGDVFCWWQACKPPIASMAPTADVVDPCSAGQSCNGTSSQASDVTSAFPESSSPTGTSTELPAPTEDPTACYVMGLAYQIGDTLPQEVGSCLECVCAKEGRVTCSPRDCSTHDEFRGGSNSLDMFDVDTF